MKSLNQLTAEPSMCRMSMLRWRWILLVGIFFLSVLGVKAQATGHYDLWDPRNPDCPCHQYQKQAEKEFNDFHQKKEVETVTVDNTHSVAKESIHSSVVMSGLGVRVHSKRPYSWTKGRKSSGFGKANKQRKMKRQRTKSRYEVCFRW